MNKKALMEEIAEHEGKVLHCYECSEGYKTIGVGHKVLETDPEDALLVFGAYDAGIPTLQTITEDRCQELFNQDIESAIDGCKRIYKNWDSFPEEFQHILIFVSSQRNKICKVWHFRGEDIGRSPVRITRLNYWIVRGVL